MFGYKANHGTMEPRRPSGRLGLRNVSRHPKCKRRNAVIGSERQAGRNRRNTHTKDEGGWTTHIIGWVINNEPLWSQATTERYKEDVVPRLFFSIEPRQVLFLFILFLEQSALVRPLHRMQSGRD